MSLYSSIDLSKTQKRSSQTPTGFIGLYDDPAKAAMLQEITDSVPQKDGSSREDLGVSDAVLQFVPSTRKRQQVPLKRKPAFGIVAPSDTNVPDTERADQTLAVLDFDRSSIKSSQMPRLEVINNFDDYANYLPDHSGLENSKELGDVPRKKSKKSKSSSEVPRSLTWNDEYEVSRPIDLDDYLRSEERLRAKEDWILKKQSLGLAGAIVPSARGPQSIQEFLPYSASTGSVVSTTRKTKLNFAPALSSAVHMIPSMDSLTGEAAHAPPPPPPEPSHATLPDHAQNSCSVIPPPIETAEEAYQRRAAMARPDLPRAKTESLTIPTNIQTTRIAYDNATGSHGPPGTYVPPPPPPPPISRTEYSAPPTRSDSWSIQGNRDGSIHSLEDHADQTRNPTTVDRPDRGSAPGQKNFAQRYMASQGWSKGQGLGSTGSGRLAPLFVKPQKDGKTGKIIDRHHKKSPSRGQGPKMSRVVLLEGMISIGEEIDVDLQQDIGESCTDAYGKVERVKLVPELGRVLVQFTDAISALRCTSTVEGRLYAGKSVSARYYSEDDFDKNIWSM